MRARRSRSGATRATDGGGGRVAVVETTGERWRHWVDRVLRTIEETSGAGSLLLREKLPRSLLRLSITGANLHPAMRDDDETAQARKRCTPLQRQPSLPGPTTPDDDVPSFAAKQGPLAIDLFSGAGGLTAGLKQAGFRVAGAVEVDATSASSYVLNHPDTYLWIQDIRSLSGFDISNRLGIQPGELELLAGCPPCQGFSALRTRNARKAANDARNDLIFDFVRLVQQLLPRMVMLENVPGLEQDARFLALHSRLHAVGYTVEHRVLNAADYGVPQRRKRLLLLARRDAHPCFPKKAATMRTVRKTIENMPPAGFSGDPLHDLPERRSARIRELIRLVPKDGGSRSAVPQRLLPPCHRGHTGHNDVFGRMAWDRVAPTITSGCHNPSRGRFLHPEHDRAITLREAALLQSFPPKYQFSLARGKEHLALQIGNALPPEMIRRIARSLLQQTG